MPSLSELKDFDFDSTRYAPGYIAFLSMARSISDEWVTMQFLQAIYVNCIIFWFFFRYSRNIFFCIIIYALSLYFNFMCEVMREACAVATLLMAWPFFIQKKWLQYYTLAIICVLFHTSGFVSLILPILYLPKIRNFFMIGKHTIFVLLGCFVLGSVVGYGLTNYLKIFYFINGLEKSIGYYEDLDISGQILNLNGIISTIILWCAYPCLATSYIKGHTKTKHSHDISNHINFMVGIGVIVAVLTIPVTIFYRYNNYFFPFSIIAIGNWVYTKHPMANLKFKFRYSNWLLIFAPFFFLCTYNYFLIKDDGHIYEMARYYPYSSIIEKSTNPERERVQYFHHAY